MNEPWACILSFNRETKEMLHQECDGENPQQQAEALLEIVRPDFPKDEGWHHVIVKNKEASEAYVDEWLLDDETLEAKRHLQDKGYEVSI